MKAIQLAVAITAVLAQGAPVLAKNVLYRITPENIGKQRNAFTVKVTDAGKLKQIEITARLAPTPNFNPISPRGELSIAGKDGKVESVSMTVAAGQVTFTIRIAPEDLDAAWFTYTENTDSPFPYRGETFTFRLRDFANAAKR
jgi:hypothetical protein